MQFSSIYENTVGNSPEGKNFLNVCVGCVLLFSLKCAFPFVLSCLTTMHFSHYDLGGSICWVSIFLLQYGINHRFLVWFWSEVNKAKLNCFKYVWGTNLCPWFKYICGENVMLSVCLKGTSWTFWLSSLFFSPPFFVLLYDIFEDEFWQVYLLVIW